MEADWKKIRKEYIKGGTSYRKLAVKYGISRGAIERRAKAEKWQEKRDQIDAKCVAKTVESVAAQEARIDTSVYELAMDLMGAFKRSVEAMNESGIMTPDMLKEYGGALRQIQLVMDSKPTELDVQEQKARIEKLRKEAQSDDDDDDTGVILLPPVMEVSDG